MGKNNVVLELELPKLSKDQRMFILWVVCTAWAIWTALALDKLEEKLPFTAINALWILSFLFACFYSVALVCIVVHAWIESGD